MTAMEVIKTYLDNVFAAYPQTKEVKNMKQDMLANMEEKYNMLRQSGKSEHEAAYSVIADFGNIEEITAELGLDIKSGAMDGSIHLSLDEAETYIAKMKKSGLWIGLGVWLIIAGASTYVSSIAFLSNGFALFPAIAIAVVMFIVTGSRMRAYESFDETHIHLDSHTRKLLEDGKGGISMRSTAMIAAGTAFIILAAGAFTMINFPLPLFLNVVGFSVFLFIFAGYQHSAFDVLLGKGDYINKAAIKKSGRIIGTVAAVYWPVIVAVNMYLLFVVRAQYFWVIWPVAGVLFGAFCAGVSVWYATKEREGRNR